jgi:hypothetical protein
MRITTLDNSDSKIKFRHISTLGNLLLFRSMGRGAGESKYPWRIVVYNNDPKSSDLIGNPPCIWYTTASGQPSCYKTTELENRESPRFCFQTLGFEAKSRRFPILLRGTLRAPVARDRVNFLTSLENCPLNNKYKAAT